MIDLIFSIILLTGSATGLLVQSNLAIKSASNIKSIQENTFQLKNLADLKCNIATLPANQKVYKCTTNSDKPQSFYVFA